MRSVLRCIPTVDGHSTVARHQFPVQGQQRTKRGACAALASSRLVPSTTPWLGRLGETQSSQAIRESAAPHVPSIPPSPAGHSKGRAFPRVVIRRKGKAGEGIPNALYGQGSRPLKASPRQASASPPASHLVHQQGCRRPVARFWRNGRGREQRALHGGSGPWENRTRLDGRVG